jgi:hypothetical protein
MSENIDIFTSAKPQGGDFFKFKNVGDSIQGTYIDKRNGIDSFNNAQTIYIIQDATGKVWNLGFRQTAVVIHERMNGIRFGQIVGFRFDEERESKRTPGTKIKIIRIYADPKLVDQKWLDDRKAIEEKYGPTEPLPPYTAPTVVSQQIPAHPKPNSVVVPPSPQDEFDEGDVTPEGEQPFKAPVDAAPAGGNLPATDTKPRSEALDAIRTLAMTKGLTNDQMSPPGRDKIIELYTGYKLTDENATKIIIKLTGYVDS